MLITCPSCSSRYEVDTRKLGAVGRQVRCSQCRTSFFVTPEGASSLSVDRVPDTIPESPVPDLPDAQVGETFQENLAKADQDGPQQEEKNAPHVADDAVVWPTPDLGMGSSVQEEMGSRLSFSALASHPEKLKSREKHSRLGSFLSRVWHKISAPLRWFPPVINAVVLCGCIGGGLYVFRENIVRTIPQTSGIYALIGLPVNLRGLALEEISSRLVTETDSPTLVVEGYIRNITSRTMSVPLINLSLRAQDTQALYSWTIEPQRPKLKSGERLAFRARLASPPIESTDVLVRFTARDPESAPVSAQKSTEVKSDDSPSHQEGHATDQPQGSFPEKIKKEE
jgi:predicted Zn finger-like uncharacterized protein